jgi:hypothetical protein
VVLSEEERGRLTSWARRRSTAQGLTMRARVVPAYADGGSIVAVAARLRLDRKTVARWRSLWVPRTRPPMRPARIRGSARRG